MAKVLTFSRVFPKYHPRAGEPTHFVEKVLKSFSEINHPINEIDELALDPYPNGLSEEAYETCLPKYHTIRAGNRFKAGDYFSPRVWSGKPYNSKQIVLAPDMKVEKIWDIEIAIGMEGIRIDGDWHFEKYPELLTKLSANDGLSTEDFKNWFSNPSFEGQIICWNKEIEY